MKLTSKNVTDIIRDCLWKPEEISSPDTPPDNTVFGEGITMRMGFNPERLQEHKEDVRSMLLELPEDFLASKGGGWSFLNACVTKDGVQWGEHRNVEELILLGNAWLGEVHCAKSFMVSISRRYALLHGRRHGEII